MEWMSEVSANSIHAMAMLFLAIAGGGLAIAVGRLARADRVPQGHRNTAWAVVVCFSILGLSAAYAAVAHWVSLPPVSPWLWLSVTVFALLGAAAVWVGTSRFLESPSMRARLLQLQGDRSELLESLDERTRALAQSEALFNQALKGSTIIVFAQDTELTYTWIYNPAPGWESENILGKSDRDLLPEPARGLLIPFKERVLQTGEVLEGIDAQLPIGLEFRDFVIRIQPRLQDGVITGIICTAVDVTERKEQERHLRLVMRELTHRSKNLLAVVQAIARQMATTTPDIDEYVQGFAERLQSLSGAHDLLVNEEWRGASLAEIANNQLGPLVDPDETRFAIEGDPLIVSPAATQNLALALHELATNAAKQGALSAPAGSVLLRWQRQLVSVRDREEPGVVLEWVENGGPEVGMPVQSGFGRLVLSRIVPRGLGGDAELEFLPSGVRWRLVFPERGNLVTSRTPG